METSDWITLSSAVLIVAGWFVTNWLNRRNEIEKVRLKLRTEILLSFLDFHTETYFQLEGLKKMDKDFFHDLTVKTAKFQHFGTKEERDMCKSMGQKLKDSAYRDFADSLNKMRDIVSKRIRKELRFPE